jgi:hypothetical protein
LVNDWQPGIVGRTMAGNIETLKKSAVRELGIFLSLLFFGLLILPLAIYFVGKAVFGEYGGSGFGAFYGTLHRAIRASDPVVLFLVLSPYLIWQLTRLTAWGFKWARRHRSDIRG